MAKKLFLLIAIFTIVVSAIPGLGRPGEQDSVAGTVKNDKDVAIGGAIVRAVASGSGVTTSIITASNGTFRIPQLRPGEYQVSAEKKGYLPSTPKTLKAGQGEKLSLVLTGQSSIPAQKLSTADIAMYLPEAPDKKIVVSTCGNCHGLSWVVSKGRSRNEWEQVVKRMSNILYDSGLAGNNPNEERITDYLAKHFGPDSGLAEQIGQRVKKDSRDSLPPGTDLVYTEYDIPTPVALPHTAVPDKNGSVWFTEFNGRKIGRLNRSTGKIKEYPLKTPGVGPHGITVAPDGTPWFTGIPFVIGRINPNTDQMEEFVVPNGKDGAGSTPHTIIVAKSGKIWFSELRNGSISSFDPVTKKFTRYQTDKGSVYALIEHGDDMFWFCQPSPGRIGYLNGKTGEIKTFDIPTKDSRAQRLRFDSSGRIWFGEYGAGKIGMFDPSTQQFAEYELPFMGSPYCVHIDGRGYIWAASFERDSLVRMDPKTKQMIEYALPGVGAIVRDIWPDETGRMWFVQWGRNKVTSAEQLVETAARK